MEDVDRMIVDCLLNDLHCSFSDQVSTLSDFGSAQLVEGIIRCIWRCRPESAATFSTYQLPVNPIERFRLASKISQEVQAIGVRDQQIGYQALLYPNVFDSRHIFLALFERFPKETVRPAEKALTPLERLKTDVGAAIADQLKGQWTPEFCRFYDLQRIGQLWYPRGVNKIFGNNGEGEEEDDVWAFVSGDGDGTRSAQQQQQQKQIVQTTNVPPKIAPKPKVATNPKLLALSPLPSGDEQSNNAEFLPANSSQKSENIREKIVQKRSTLAQKRRMFAELRRANCLLAEQIVTCQHRTEDERLLQLLDGAEENMQKLEHYIAGANDRRIALENKFADAQRQRIERLEELSCVRTAPVGMAQSEDGKMAELDATVEALEELLEQRRRIRQKLLRECQKMDDDATIGQNSAGGRAKYVQRILEMSAMVGKQNEEIRRTAKSVQSLRREIDQLIGSLERTFIAVDRWLSKHAETNPRMQRAYKLMVRTHEQCSIVMTCIEDQGQLSRQTDELIGKIGVEQQKSVDEQLEKLLDDLMLIKHENNEMEKSVELGK